MGKRPILIISLIILLSYTVGAEIEFRSDQAIQSYNDFVFNNGTTVQGIPKPSNPDEVVPKSYSDDTGIQNLSDVLNKGNKANLSINMDGNEINNIPTPSNNPQPVPKGFADSNYYNIDGDSLNGTLDAAGNDILNIGGLQTCSLDEFVDGNGNCKDVDAAVDDIWVDEGSADLSGKAIVWNGSEIQINWSDANDLGTGGNIEDFSQADDLKSTGEIKDGNVENIELDNSQITVAGNAVSLGSSTSVDHSDLNGVNRDNHHSVGDGIQWDGSDNIALDATDLDSTGNLQANVVSFSELSDSMCNSNEVLLYTGTSWGCTDKSNLGNATDLTGGDGIDPSSITDGDTLSVAWGDAVGLNSTGGPNDFSNADDLKSDGDIKDGNVENPELANSQVTVAGNTISLGGSSAVSINELNDVASSSESAGQTLLWDASSSEYSNSALTAGDGLGSSSGDASFTFNVNTGNGIETNSDSVRVNPAGIAGDGLKETSATSLGVEPGDFAGTYLSDDGSDNLQVDIGNGLQGDGSQNIEVYWNDASDLDSNGDLDQVGWSDFDNAAQSDVDVSDLGNADAALNMNAYRIQNVPAPQAASDAVNKTYVDDKAGDAKGNATQTLAEVLDEGNSANQQINMNSYRLTNIPTPENPGDSVNKSYVDSKTNANTDENVAVDSSAAAGYLGNDASGNDGVLRTNSPITYTDNGDSITLDIGTGGIDKNELASSAVTSTEINSTVLSSIANSGEVQSGDIGTGEITSSEINSNAVRSAELDETDTYSLGWGNLGISKSDVNAGDVGTSDGITSSSGNIQLDADDLSSTGSLKANVVASSELSDSMCSSDKVLLYDGNNWVCEDKKSLGNATSLTGGDGIDPASITDGDTLTVKWSDANDLDSSGSAKWGNANDLDSSGNLDDFADAGDLKSNGDIKDGNVENAELANSQHGINGGDGINGDTGIELGNNADISVNWNDASDLDSNGDIQSNVVGNTEIDNSVNIDLGTLDVAGGSSGDGTQSGLSVDSNGNLYFDGSLNFPGRVNTVSAQEINGSVIPDQDSTFNLGSASYRWDEAYISSNIQGTDIINSDNINSGAVDSSEIASNSVGSTELVNDDITISGGDGINGDTITLGNTGTVSVNWNDASDLDSNGDISSFDNANDLDSNGDISSGAAGNYLSVNSGSLDVADNWVDESGDTMSGDLDVNSNNIKNVNCLGDQC